MNADTDPPPSVPAGQHAFADPNLEPEPSRDDMIRRAHERIERARERQRRATERLDETRAAIAAAEDPERVERLEQEAERHDEAVSVHRHAIFEQEEHIRHLQEPEEQDDA